MSPGKPSMTGGVWFDDLWFCHRFWLWLLFQNHSSEKSPSLSNMWHSDVVDWHVKTALSMTVTVASVTIACGLHPLQFAGSSGALGGEKVWVSANFISLCLFLLAVIQVEQRTTMVHATDGAINALAQGDKSGLALHYTKFKIWKINHNFFLSLLKWSLRISLVKFSHNKTSKILHSFSGGMEAKYAMAQSSKVQESSHINYNFYCWYINGTYMSNQFLISRVAEGGKGLYTYYKVP